MGGCSRLAVPAVEETGPKHVSFALTSFQHGISVTQYTLSYIPVAGLARHLPHVIIV